MMASLFTCTKVRYVSERDANIDIERIRKKSKRATIPIRSYLCNVCHVWHLTSREDWNKKIAEQNAEIGKLKANENSNLDKVVNENKILKEELNALKQELNNLKSTGTKEERVMIRADIRVKKLSEQLTEKDKIINNLRKGNNEMIVRLVQLQKQIENK